jgi:hypothetical protein
MTKFKGILTLKIAQEKANLLFAGVSNIMFQPYQNLKFETKMCKKTYPNSAKKS